MSTTQLREWTGAQLIAFRIAFVFFISICIPNSTEWYDTVIHINWAVELPRSL